MENKTAILNPFVRQKYSENFEEIAKIREKIKIEIDEKVAGEIKLYREENDRLIKEEKEFKSLAASVMKDAFNTKSRVIVSSQTGRNGSTIREYRGYITKMYDDYAFDLSAENYNDGKPFTIGLSCLQSIEISEPWV